MTSLPVFPKNSVGSWKKSTCMLLGESGHLGKLAWMTLVSSSYWVKIHKPLSWVPIPAVSVPLDPYFMMEVSLIGVSLSLEVSGTVLNL